MFEDTFGQAVIHLWYLNFLLILQLSNDTCLAYTLAAMSNLLSEMGIASTTCVLGSSYSPVTSTASSLSVQQRVYILLKESLRRADSLKLRRLVASNHLAMAKFELMVRSLLSCDEHSFFLIYLDISLSVLRICGMIFHLEPCVSLTSFDAQRTRELSLCSQQLEKFFIELENI